MYKKYVEYEKVRELLGAIKYRDKWVDDTRQYWEANDKVVKLADELEQNIKISTKKGLVEYDGFKVVGKVDTDYYLDDADFEMIAKGILLKASYVSDDDEIIFMVAEEEYEEYTEELGEYVKENHKEIVKAIFEKAGYRG